jgi:Family of unknown function (DUF5996)
MDFRGCRLIVGCTWAWARGAGKSAVATSRPNRCRVRRVQRLVQRKDAPRAPLRHGLDLAVTRFSGRPGAALDASPHAGAYTHEVISFGFWAGDDDRRRRPLLVHGPGAGRTPRPKRGPPARELSMARACWHCSPARPCAARGIPNDASRVLAEHLRGRSWDTTSFEAKCVHAYAAERV